MKNIKKIILVVMVVMTSITSKAQQLLHQGTVVMTHSPYHGNCTATSPHIGNGNVVAILDASNTSGIPSTSGNKFVWTQFTTGNNKPLWVSKTDWVADRLGKVFGITLDDTGNIYVSNTSIYNGETLLNHDKIYKLDRITGNSSVVFDYADFTSINSPNKGLGNLKIFKIGAINFLAFTCWENGKIYILKQPSGGLSSVAKWTVQDSIKPSKLNATSVPYGIAVRPKPLSVAGIFEVYYGVYDMASTTGHHTDINKIEIDNVGHFIAGSEAVILSSISSTSTYCSNGTGTVDNNTSIPIADISFSSDFKKMVVGEQGLNNSFTYQAHNSIVHEYEYGTSWTTTSSVLPCGNIYNQGGSCPINGLNAVGGVSYWNNILFADGQTQCDTSILYSTDLIYLSSAYSSSFTVPLNEVVTSNNFGLLQNQSTVSVYGFQGLASKNTFTSSLNASYASLKVDADDIYNLCDKWALGDIEAFNESQNCAPPCNCGTWQSIQKGADTNYWVNTDPPTTPTTITWMQGAPLPTDPIIPHYNCTNSCEATYTYALSSTAHGASSIPLTANSSGSLLLSSNAQTLNNLPCGPYFLIIIPKCGTNTCPPVRIPIVIQCPPPCSTCSGNAEVGLQGTPSILTGSVAVNYTLSNSTPVTEVRVSVEDFRVINVTGNENCLICQNQPKSWGSIQSANLTGVTNTTALSSDVTVDNREVVFKNIPLFNLTGNVLAMNLALPQTTGLSCCTLKAEVCIKFIIRDINCCEREITKCFSVDLK